MTRPAISVEKLGKAYRIGLEEEAPDTLLGQAARFLKAPVRNLSNLRRLNTANAADADDIVWALKDVSFEVQPGEVVGVIGRNGAGKSTLLKILSRITEPTTGHARIRGRVSSLLEVGTGFHPDLSGRDNVYMNGTILGMTKREIDAKFDEIAAFSGVEKFLDTPIKRYSSGMKVRLAFSVAAHLEPEILIIDEVLAVGDAEFQRKCLGKMQDVAGQGRTVLFVSHNMAAVEGLCTRAIVLQDGRLLVDTEPPEDAMEAYRRSCESSSSAGAVGSGDGWRVSVLDEHGDIAGELELGRPFMLSLHVDLPEAVAEPQVGIGIDDAFGSRVLTLHNPKTHTLGATRGGHLRVRCTVPQSPLVPGRYTVKVAVSAAGGSLFTEAQAAAFTVQDGNAFGEGRGFHRGSCVAPSQWIAEQASGRPVEVLGFKKSVSVTRSML